MQRLSGSGIAFVEFDGYVKEYTLAPGQDRKSTRLNSSHQD